MKKELTTAVLFTLATTVVFGFLYPLAVTGVAQLLFPDQANGSLIRQDGRVVGSRLLAQPFSGAQYFHPRPSAAGPDGYDPLASGASNLGPTNQKLVDRVAGDVKAIGQESRPVPIDLVTTSASGLDPDVSPLAALYQASRVASARGMSQEEVRALIDAHTAPRQFGVFGEPRVNVLELNLELDQHHPLYR